MHRKLHLFPESKACLTLLFSIFAAFALRFESLHAADTIDWQDFWGIYEAYYDEAQPIQQAAFTALKQVDRDKDPILWMRVLRSYLLVEDEIKRVLPLESEIPKAIAIATKNQLQSEHVLLLNMQAILMENSGNHEKIKDSAQIFEKALKLAREYGLGREYRFVIYSFLNYLFLNGQIERAVTLVNEGLAMARSDPKATLFDLMQMQRAAAVAFKQGGQRERATQMFDALGEECKSIRARSFCSLVYYDLANIYSRVKKGQDISKPMAYLTKSMELAKEVNVPATIGFSLLAKSRLESSQDLYREAKAHADEAAPYFQKIGFIEDYGQARIDSVAASLGLNDETTALRILKALQTEIPDTYVETQLVIHRQLSNLLEKRGEWKEALAVRNKQIELERKSISDRASTNFSQQTAQLGLQVEEEKSKLLQKENEIQARRLEAGELQQRLRTYAAAGALLLALISFAALARITQKNEVIRRSRQSMKNILDNIDEGIMVLDRNLQLVEGHSAYLERIVGTALLHKRDFNIFEDFFRTASLPTDTIDVTKAALQASIGETDLGWELNSGQLPLELVRQQHIFTLHWQPLHDMEGRVFQVLLSVRDVTEKRNLEQAMLIAASEKDRMKHMLEEVLSHELGSSIRFIEKTGPELQNCARLLFDKPDMKAAFRVLHTLKGEARSLGLKTLASAIHDMEFSINIPENALISREKSEFLWKILGDAFGVYERLLASFKDQKTPGLLTAPRSLYEYAPVYRKEIMHRLDAAALSFAGLILNDGVANWHEAALTQIHSMLIHSVSNSVDHGFIRPAQEGRPLDPARISIEACRHEGLVTIRVTDNGAGLNWSRLEALAQKINFPFHDQASLAAIVFEDGISTASRLSETSGRGVGMSAVKAMCQELGGEVHFIGHDKGGTTLTLQWPESQVCVAIRPGS